MKVEKSTHYCVTVVSADGVSSCRYPPTPDSQVAMWRLCLDMESQSLYTCIALCYPSGYDILAEWPEVR